MRSHNETVCETATEKNSNNKRVKYDYVESARVAAEFLLLLKVEQKHAYYVLIFIRRLK